MCVLVEQLDGADSPSACGTCVACMKRAINEGRFWSGWAAAMLVVSEVLDQTYLGLVCACVLQCR
jgi:hypothetical protein